MKNWINKVYMLAFCSLAFVACEKDEDRLVVRAEGEPVLSATSSNLVLDQSNADENAVTFSWTPYKLTWSDPDLSHSNAVRYTLQVAMAGSTFAEPEEVEINGANEQGYTVATFNALLNKMELPVGSPSNIEARLVTTIGDNIAPLYSNVVSMTVTPYVDLVEYASMFLPGGYQGWDPGTAATIASVKDDGVYEGYVNFTDGNTEFKITPQPNWDTDYGADRATPNDQGASGTLKVQGSNLTVANAGYYLIRANINDLTWSATRTTWGVIGDATAGGWDSDQDLTFDPATQTWKATLNLTAGAIKFRANDAWDINYGDANGDLFLDTMNDNNIAIEEAGRYEITMNLSNAGNYRYSLKML